MVFTYLHNISYKLHDNIDSLLSETLLFSSPSFDANDNTKLINLTITYILSTKGFDGGFL